MKVRHGMTIAVLLLLGTLVAYLLSTSSGQEPAQVRSLRTAQEADAPDGELREFTEGFLIPPFDPRLDLLSGIDRFRIPLANRFDQPMGTAHGALTYNAQSFWEMNSRRGGRHTGDDINGVGGMNSDLGDPIYAVANGLVIYAGEPSPGWGKTVLIAHRTEDGRIIQSMYAHLQAIVVSLDQRVARGQNVGRVGTAGGRYLAHLHFEMHEADGVSLGAGYVNYRTNRLDPTGTVTQLRGAEDEDLGVAFTEILQQIQRENLTLPVQ